MLGRFITGPFRVRMQVRGCSNTRGPLSFPRQGKEVLNESASCTERAGARVRAGVAVESSILVKMVGVVGGGFRPITASTIACAFST